MLPCPSATVKQRTTENDPPVKQHTTENDPPVKQHSTVNDQPESDLPANDQSMMEQLKKARANRKYVLTIAYKATKRTALEHNRDAVLAHRQLLMTAFKLFERASNEYLEVLEREEDVQCAEDYYDIEEKVYIENLKMLNSAMEELSSYSFIIDSSSNCVSAVSPLLNVSTAVMLPACEPELSHVPQNEASESVTDEHIPLPDIHPDSSVSPSCSEHIPVSESKVTNLSQKEQSKCMTSMCEEHISSPEVISESPVSPSPPEICSEPHISNYHHQLTVNVFQCYMELQDDHIVMSLHDIPIGDYETLMKQMQPCSVGAQSLISDQLMCLYYSARDPSNIDSVNDSGMLICQNLPGG